MRSKTSYFNPTLFRKNLTRFWPLWGGASALGALAPLALLTWLIQAAMDGSTRFSDPLAFTSLYYNVLSWFVPVASLFYAALCALAVWHYLYNARALSLYHALPITRKGLFVTNFLSGMAMMLIPYAVAGLLSVAISLFTGLFEPVGVLVTILGVLGESFFYFSAATLVIFLTGNPFAFAAFYFILHFFAVGAEGLLSELTTLFYFGVSGAYEGVAEFLSPTVYLLRHLECLYHYSAGDYKLEAVTWQNGWLVAVYALVGAALLAGAWLLYCRRRSECAGDVVAVGWMKPVFRYGVALCAALGGGTLLYAVLCAGFQRGSTVAAVPMATCMAAAGVVGYYIASMLLAKSLKVFRGSGAGALATAAAAAAVCLVIAADPLGVESWVPEAGELQSVSLYLDGGFSGQYVSASVKDPAVIQRLLDLQRSILAEEDSLDQQGRQPRRCSVRLFYYLADGKTVHRDYSLYCADEDFNRSDAIRQAADLACDPVIQESNIFGHVSPGKADEDIVSGRITGGFMNMAYDDETGEFQSLDLSQEDAVLLDAAVRRDIQAGRFGRTLLMPDYDQYQNSVYRGYVSLSFNLTIRQQDQNHNSSRSIDLSVSVYCTETLKALEEIGAVGGSRRLMLLSEYYALAQSGAYPYDYEDPIGYSYSGYSEWRTYPVDTEAY